MHAPMVAITSKTCPCILLLFFFLFLRTLNRSVHMFLSAQYCISSTTMYYPTVSVDQELGYSWLTGSSDYGHKATKCWPEMSSHLEAQLGKDPLPSILRVWAECIPWCCGIEGTGFSLAVSWGCPQLFAAWLLTSSTSKQLLYNQPAKTIFRWCSIIPEVTFAVFA